MATSFDIEPADATLGAIIRGIKINALDKRMWEALHEIWLEYALLIFPAQHLTRGEQIDFARRFGPLEAEMLKISNVKADGTLYTLQQDEEYLHLLEATHEWHTDSSYKPIHAKGSVFCAEIIPPGGTQTGWADMRAAYDALDPALRTRIEGLCAYHSFHQRHLKRGHTISREIDAKVRDDGLPLFGLNDGPPPLRPLVKIHPETGRKSLLLGQHVCGIKTMTEDESERLLRELMEFACQPPRTYHHSWQPGDAVLWDNRCLLHRSRPWDLSLPRVMWHTRIAGDPVTEAAL
jgi:alpha-ketoglutarate-dependent taurine dioxygenase